MKSKTPITDRLTKKKIVVYEKLERHAQRLETDLRNTLDMASFGMIQDGCPWCEKIHDIINNILKEKSIKSVKRNTKRRKEYKEARKTEQWVKNHI